jgi:hypothetical protein
MKVTGGHIEGNLLPRWSGSHLAKTYMHAFNRRACFCYRFVSMFCPGASHLSSPSAFAASSR